MGKKVFWDFVGPKNPPLKIRLRKSIIFSKLEKFLYLKAIFQTLKIKCFNLNFKFHFHLRLHGLYFHFLTIRLKENGHNLKTIDHVTYPNEKVKLGQTFD